MPGLFSVTESAIIIRLILKTMANELKQLECPQETQAESQRLAEAFRIFNQASEELSTAYTSLQGQVEALTGELAAANGALRQQYLEKAALTERLTLLLSALPAGVVVLDAGGVIVQANPAAEFTLGATLAGQAWTAIESTHFVPTETPGEYTADADRRLAVTVTAFDSAGGRIVLLHDITEAHRLNAQAERQERLAAMGEMAAQLAHQLRTPLAAALLYAANLENPEISATLRISIAQKTVARLKHLERLIQDMLLFARGEVLGREIIDVDELIQDLRQTIEPLARARQIDFSTEVDGLSLALQGNRKAIVGALINLLENALQAAGLGGVEGHAGQVLLAVRSVSDALAFVIRDNGPGMEPGVVARLFEPFFTTRAEGTGLGLAIARGVARAHGGKIEVTSAPGAGTEFIVTLPLPRPAGDSTEKEP